MMSSKPSSANFARYAGLTSQWMVMLGIATWGGYKLDKITGWRIPVFVIVFPLGSLLFSLWRLVKEVNKPNE